MMKIIGVVVLTLIFLNSCVSTGISLKSIDTENAYLAGKFQRYQHGFELINLETDKIIHIHFADSDIPIFNIIPTGRWAITGIYGISQRLFYSEEAYIPIVNSLMTIIEANAGSVTFLGEFEYEVDFHLDLLTRHDFYWSYPFDNFVDYVETNQETIGPIEIQPLRKLSVQ